MTAPSRETGARYTSRDGLCQSIHPEAIELWDKIVAEFEAAKGDWRARLREIGVKLAHPDDGWVSRDAERPTLSPSYPLFNDLPVVGDIVALGCPPRYKPYYVPRFNAKGNEWTDNGYRLVRVTEIKHGTLIPYTDYYFEETGIRLPPPPATIAARRWFHRLVRRSRDS